MFQRLFRKTSGSPLRQDSNVHQAQNAIQGTPDQHVWNHGKNDRNDKSLPRIKPAKSDELVHGIHNHGHGENFADCLPALSKKIPPSCRVCKDRPEVRRLSIMRIVESVSQREEDGHCRLKQKAKLQGPR